MSPATALLPVATTFMHNIDPSFQIETEDVLRRADFP
jgi:hypothetical protein